MSNGGCSHKYVNTVGGYKCECPDPELKLSLDNRTCQGNYITIHNVKSAYEPSGSSEPELNPVSIA